MKNIIEVNNLTKVYGDFKAIDNISFQVDEGSLFAFLGPNGAGKSTTINIICTLLDKTDGKVNIGGFELSSKDDEIRNLAGVVFQESLLDDLLTVRENILARGSFYGIKSRDLTKRISQIIQVLDLGEFIDKKYGTLSGGQKRRADIARALINTPKILFLDEPTTGLDPQTRQYVWNTVKKIQENTKMTVFLTTHYMEEAANADKVVIIDHGKIVASGTPAELRVKYSKDRLKIIPQNDYEVKKYLEQNGFRFTIGAGILDVAVENSMVALGILKQNEHFIENFEVIRGSMDDVFINITGRKIREGT